MDAVRIEASDVQKVLDRRTQLMNIMKQENLSQSDKEIVRDLLIDMQDALGKELCK